MANTYKKVNRAPCRAAKKKQAPHKEGLKVAARDCNLYLAEALRTNLRDLGAARPDGANNFTLQICSHFRRDKSLKVTNQNSARSGWVFNCHSSARKPRTQFFVNEERRIRGKIGRQAREMRA